MSYTDSVREQLYNVEIKNKCCIPHEYAAIHLCLAEKQGDFKKASVLNQRIDQVLFVSDIINVIIDKKKSDFHKFRTKGFYVNGIHYVYLCSGSGQIRRNTATFVNEEYRDILVERINCGLDKKTSSFVLWSTIVGILACLESNSISSIIISLFAI